MTKAAHETGSQSQPYPIGSIAKSLTAALIYNLEQSRELTGSTRMSDILPWFSVGGRIGEEITIDQLLTHTSGIATNAHKVVWRHKRDLADSLEAGIRALARQRLLSRPGQRFIYSNMNYALLGYVAEHLYAKRYEQLVWELVLGPAGMSSTAFLTRCEGGHYWLLGRKVQTLDEAQVFIGPAGGAWMATHSDLSKYLAQCLISDSLPGRVVAAASAQGAERGDGYYWGWRCSMGAAGQLVLYHEGHSAGHSTAIVMDPKARTGCVMACDVAGVNLTGAAAAIMSSSQPHGDASTARSVSRFAAVASAILALQLVILALTTPLPAIALVGGLLISVSLATLPSIQWWGRLSLPVPFSNWGPRGWPWNLLAPLLILGLDGAATVARSLWQI